MKMTMKHYLTIYSEMKRSMNKLTDKEIANDKAKRIMNGIATWCSYYRSNPHRFCKDYLNVQFFLHFE